MKRRDFLQLASATGLVIPYWGWIPDAYAQSAPYTGKFAVHIHASGGLDCSSWADPRESQPTVNNYAQAGIPAGVAGNIRYAPIANNATFFQAHFRRMRVLNGVNSETNSHDDGTRAHATGMLAMGHANIAELFAHAHGGNMPFKWLNQGGFNISQGLVPPTATPNANSLLATLQPNRNNATTDFIKRGDLDKIFEARAARLAAMKASGTVAPGSQRVNDQFLSASQSRAMLEQAAQMMPATFDANFTAAHIGLECMKAGIACTMQVATGGFDTHSNNEAGQIVAITRLNNLINFFWDKAAELGIANRMFLRVYSEFSRTRLNNQNGKDHYGPGGCQIIMEQDPPWGNSVMGASGPQHQSVRIDRNTGAIDPVNGLVMRPRHIHRAMRQYLGIPTTEPRFDLGVPASEEFNIFGPGINTGYPTP